MKLKKAMAAAGGVPVCAVEETEPKSASSLEEGKSDRNGESTGSKREHAYVYFKTKTGFMSTAEAPIAACTLSSISGEDVAGYSPK